MKSAPFALSIPEASGISKESALSLIGSFEEFTAQAEEWRQKAALCVVSDESDKKGMAFARESRLGLRSVRVSIEKTRVTLKGESLRYGQAVDAVANTLKSQIEPIEEYLLEQEQFAERAETKRIDARFSQRVEMLKGIEWVFPFPSNLREMSGEEFQRLYTDTKDLVQVRKDREAAAEAERQRIEAAEAQALIEKAKAARLERERITAENDKLRKEAEERERLAAIERKKADDSSKLREEEVEKERAKLEAAAAEERKARQKLQDEIDAKNKAEAEALLEKQKAEQKAAKAPEKEKLKAFIVLLHKIEVPDVSIAPKIHAALQSLSEKIEEYIKAI